MGGNGFGFFFLQKKKNQKNKKTTHTLNGVKSHLPFLEEQHCSQVQCSPKNHSQETLLKSYSFQQESQDRTTT